MKNGKDIADKLRKMLESFKERPTPEAISAKLKEMGLDGEVTVMAGAFHNEVEEQARDIAKFCNKQYRKRAKHDDFAKPKLVSAMTMALVAAGKSLGCPPEILIQNFLHDVEQAYPNIECKHTMKVMDKEGEDRAPVGFLGKPIEC